MAGLRAVASNGGGSGSGVNSINGQTGAISIQSTSLTVTNPSSGVIDIEYTNTGTSVTGTSPYTFSGATNILEIAPAIPANSTVLITTSALVRYKTYSIVDVNNISSSYPITLMPDAGNINGNSSLILSSQGYPSVTFYWNGTNIRLL